MRELIKHIILVVFISPNLAFFSYSAKAGDLSLDLVGQIESRCELSLMADNTIDLSNIRSKTLPFNVYCNQPLRMSISSRNGGLLASDGNQEFGVNRYLLEISIAKLGIKKQISSSDLTSENSVDSSGVIPFSTQGEIRVTLEDNLLYAGNYQDVIEIDVYPSINDIKQ